MTAAVTAAAAGGLHDRGPHHRFDTRVREMHRQGATVVDMEVELGCSLWPIRESLRRLGLRANRPQKPIAIDPATLRRLHAQGMSDRAIAERLGVATSSVSAARRDAGLSAQGRTGHHTALRRNQERARRAAAAAAAAAAADQIRVEIRDGVRVTICPPRWAHGARPTWLG